MAWLSSRKRHRDLSLECPAENVTALAGDTRRQIDGDDRQVAYLGFPATTSAPFIDYLVADRHIVPPEREASYSEKIVRLPDCYQVNDRQRRIAADTPSRRDAGLPEQGFVFCSFNNSYKILPAVFDVWMKLLHAVERSVLWLLEDNAAAVARLKAAAEARGVSSSRLVFAPRVPLDQHLARHRLADLFLDTFPVNAHTTASDALWTGLPLVTLQGETFTSRVAASVLSAAGLPELVARSLADYEALALRLARDPAELARLKARLERTRLTAPLFDTEPASMPSKDTVRRPSEFVLRPAASTCGVTTPAPTTFTVRTAVPLAPCTSVVCTVKVST